MGAAGALSIYKHWTVIAVAASSTNDESCCKPATLVVASPWPPVYGSIGFVHPGPFLRFYKYTVSKTYAEMDMTLIDCSRSPVARSDGPHGACFSSPQTYQVFGEMPERASCRSLTTTPARRRPSGVARARPDQPSHRRHMVNLPCRITCAATPVWYG
jgi:hypothetical protein|uniref:Uncharacterized protein n=1 Tax=Oryza sativa subsp. japonica TaxID=39947 RepID=Q6K656_ORYSJ|nr:hypothetical protein [Oryza sativa Japonica Group]